MDLKQLYALMERFEKSGLTELTFKNDGDEVTLKKGSPVVVQAGPATQAAFPAPAGHTGPAPVAAAPPTAPGIEVIRAPLVGTFYRSPAPDAAPFVEKGDRVKKGQTICILEAMKLMNEFQAELRPGDRRRAGRQRDNGRVRHADVRGAPHMIQSLLIANRGEIAVRVIRTCREMGIRTVVAYSTADSDSLAVQMADQAVCVGPPAAKDSYLNVRNLVTGAVLSRCDAIHPGVGFLAENSGFAREAIEAGLLFVGPDPDVTDLLGDKIAAKQSAERMGIPVIPGSAGSVADAAQAEAAAGEIGFPVIVKAAAGGGGKGMRIVRSPSELADVLRIASHEAEKAFSDGTLYLEKYLENPRHVEVQIVADRRGNAVHLGERDCTVQENHQKLVEESPSPVVSPELRARMGDDAVRLLHGLGYTGAGTVEFLVKNGKH